MEDKKVADYFVVAGLDWSKPLKPLEELIPNESCHKTSHPQDPIVELAVLNKTVGEQVPNNFKCIEVTPSGYPADLNHGSLRAHEMYLCYRRGRDKPPILDIGVQYENKDNKERLMSDCKVIDKTVGNRIANVNNSASSTTKIFITFRRASPHIPSGTLVVMDICIVLLNKNETAPHTHCMIPKSLNKGMMGSDVRLCYKKSMAKQYCLPFNPSLIGRYPEEDLPNQPLLDQVSMFCLPMGATLESWKSCQQTPNPVFSTFILTSGLSAQKVYGGAVIFYEEVPQEEVDKLSLAHKMALGLVGDDSCSSSQVSGDALSRSVSSGSSSEYRGELGGSAENVQQICEHNNNAPNKSPDATLHTSLENTTTHTKATTSTSTLINWQPHNNVADSSGNTTFVAQQSTNTETTPLSVQSLTPQSPLQIPTKTFSTSPTTSQSPPTTKLRVYQNKSICLLSRCPFFDTFKKFLFYIYRIVFSNQDTLCHQVSLERHIAHFLTEIPMPSIQRPRIIIQLFSTSIILSQPDDTPLPKTGASFSDVLLNLEPHNSAMLLLAVLLEHKILVHSLRPSVLTSVSEAITAMIFPLHWQCPYIPLCPLTLSYVLHSPTPFIIGIDSRYFDSYDLPPDVTCIGLDTKNLTLSEERKTNNLKMLPKRAAKQLKGTLEKCYEELLKLNKMTCDKEGNVFDDVKLSESYILKKKMQVELMIREAYLRFMASLLRGYDSHLRPVTRDLHHKDTNLNSLFDVEEFMKGQDKSYNKLYALLLKTQAFSRFIEERSFVSDRDSSLVFFDQCLSRVDDEPLIDVSGAFETSERGVLIMPPDCHDDDPVIDYKGKFPKLDASKATRTSCTPSSPTTCKLPTSTPSSHPIMCRTPHEVRLSNKVAQERSTHPHTWAQYLVWSCHYLWFIHLPSHLANSPCRSKLINTAIVLLEKMHFSDNTDEVCYRILMQMCGLHQQPILAVKLLCLIKALGVTPNAITYGYYSKAVLENKWPSSNSTSYQKWMKLRNVILAVGRFKRYKKVVSCAVNQNCNVKGCGRRSMDVGVLGVNKGDDEMVASSSKPVDDNNTAKNNRRSNATTTTLSAKNKARSSTEVASTDVPINRPSLSTGKLSDRGYGSLSMEETLFVASSPPKSSSSSLSVLSTAWKSGVTEVASKGVDGTRDEIGDVGGVDEGISKLEVDGGQVPFKGACPVPVTQDDPLGYFQQQQKPQPALQQQQPFHQLPFQLKPFQQQPFQHQTAYNIPDNNISSLQQQQATQKQTASLKSKARKKLTWMREGGATSELMESAFKLFSNKINNYKPSSFSSSTSLNTKRSSLKPETSSSFSDFSNSLLPHHDHLTATPTNTPTSDSLASVVSEDEVTKGDYVNKNGVISKMIWAAKNVSFQETQKNLVNSLLGGIRQKSDVIKGFASSFNDVMKGSFSLSEERMNEGGEYDDDGDDDDGEEEEEEGVYGNDYQLPNKKEEYSNLSYSSQDNNNNHNKWTNHNVGSMSSIQSNASNNENNTKVFPIQVIITTTNVCNKCGYLLYDEQVMAGWTPDESNLNTSCQFCHSNIVPHLNVYIKDYRNSNMQEGRKKQETKDDDTKNVVNKNTMVLSQEAEKDTLDMTRRCCSVASLREEDQLKVKSGSLDLLNYPDPLTALQTPSKGVALERLSYPYVSGMVLRKELENVICEEGERCFDTVSFIDHHPILFWNLVWFFKRINVSSHLPSLIPQSKLLPPSNHVPRVSIHCFWDDPFIHQNVTLTNTSSSSSSSSYYSPPMYMLWNDPVQETHALFSRDQMLVMIEHIKKNDVTTPIKMILEQRHDHFASSPSHHPTLQSTQKYHSIYRDLLFLCLTVLDPAYVDIEAFDDKFREASKSLSSQGACRLLSHDVIPKKAALHCRRLFAPLSLPTSASDIWSD